MEEFNTVEKPLGVSRVSSEGGSRQRNLHNRQTHQPGPIIAAHVGSEEVRKTLGDLKAIQEHNDKWGLLDDPSDDPATDGLSPTVLERQQRGIPAVVGAQAICGINDPTDGDVSVLTTSTGRQTAPTDDSAAAVTATALSQEDYEEELREMMRANLVVAKEVVAVDDDEEENAPPARSKRAPLFYTMLICFPVCLVMAVILGVALSGDDDSGSQSIDNVAEIKVPTLEPSASPSFRPTTMAPTFTESTQKVFEFIVENSFGNGSVLRDPGTPQQTALILLVREEPELDDYLIERYALLALYFSTGGSLWGNNTGWTDSKKSQCEWYGIDCDENGFVQKLDLSGNFLSGALLPELGLLGPKYGVFSPRLQGGGGFIFERQRNLLV
eukprot:scaffold3028_cov174-Amphora_coffeaeformis.AAC.24